MTGGGGRLILCGTPIGNLEDATFRLVKTLENADVIACEDVGRTRKLLSHFGIPAPTLVVYNEGNERRAATQLVRQIADGKTVALVCDAGMPGMSDPGYRLVRACVDEGRPVDVVPGPTSVISALVVSGLPSDRFVFEGWLSKKSGERAERISQLAPERRTLVFFCSPHRVRADLTALLEGFGERGAALVRELTKLHEEVRRGSLADLLAGVVDRAPKGEMVLVVAGATPAAEPVGARELAHRARRLMDEGIPRKEALAEVAKAAGVPKREVFDALIEGEPDDA
ncbi:MAG TPA: 16S rRNA (cytidine(1402)-2'-O)-methyltransferase [Actinomycetota bacterium]|nr:16S rRNA (cytidine(1402)-2'-O)-methyltransferase [Actinomycetota bacterium]